MPADDIKKEIVQSDEFQETKIDVKFENLPGKAERAGEDEKERELKVMFPDESDLAYYLAGSLGDG